MISPWSGAAFTEAPDGDVKGDVEARRRVAGTLAIPWRWATVTQLHGASVREADSPGDHGPADALYTATTGLPVAVFGADCLVAVLGGGGAVGVAHAGWRGMAAGVIGELRRAMTAAGGEPSWAALGPAIGPCCFEVGEEVAERFPEQRATTTWGTPSVDLWRAAAGQAGGLTVWRADRCTRHHPELFSNRRRPSPWRQAGLGWVP